MTMSTPMEIAPLAAVSSRPSVKKYVNSAAKMPPKRYPNDDFQKFILAKVINLYVSLYHFYRLFIQTYTF